MVRTIQLRLSLNCNRRGFRLLRGPGAEPRRSISRWRIPMFRPIRPLRVALLLLLALPAAMAANPARATTPVTVERERYLMGTRFSILLQGDEAASLDAAASAAFDEVARCEDVTSNWRADSELSRLHAALEAQGTAKPRPVAVSADLYAVLAAAKAWCVRSEGAF